MAGAEERVQSETEREKEEGGGERRRQRAHGEGEKSSGDDEIGGAAEREPVTFSSHVRHGKELYLHWRRGRRRKTA